jgi:hypothetical protein
MREEWVTAPMGCGNPRRAVPRTGGAAEADPVRRLLPRARQLVTPDGAPDEIGAMGQGFFFLSVHMHPLKYIFGIFENIKKIKQKCFIYTSMFYVSIKLFQEKTIFL